VTQDQSTYDIESVLFLLLYSEGPHGKMGEPLPSNLFLQKEAFVLSKKMKGLEAEYEPFRLGPFSEALDDTLEQLRASHFVSPEDPIHLTAQGLALARDCWEKASSDLRKLVLDTKKLFNNMTKDELLAYIYFTYPEWTENSDIREQVEGKRIDAAVSLFSKGKVSLGKAAAIAGHTVQTFMVVLQERGVPIRSYSDEDLREELSGVGRNRA
jgi:predicted HTH domain antitoxin